MSSDEGHGNIENIIRVTLSKKSQLMHIITLAVELDFILLPLSRSGCHTVQFADVQFHA